MSMKTPSIALAPLALFAVGCTEPTTTSPLFASEGSGAVHRVSVGGHDADLAENTDKNFSLIAIELGDGSVTGEWIDMFGKDPDGNPRGGIHVDVNCLSVDGSQAWIGGVIKSGTSGGVDVTGQRALTRVVDNGESASDPPDQISLSFFPVDPAISCADRPDLVLLAMTDGQVTVN
jgi:hypothetical protein